MRIQCSERSRSRTFPDGRKRTQSNELNFGESFFSNSFLAAPPASGPSLRPCRLRQTTGNRCLFASAAQKNYSFSYRWILTVSAGGAGLPFRRRIYIRSDSILGNSCPARFPEQQPASSFVRERNENLNRVFLAVSRPQPRVRRQTSSTRGFVSARNRRMAGVMRLSSTASVDAGSPANRGNAPGPWEIDSSG